MPWGGPSRERRVLKAGHSSIAVTLPKPWAQALHLRPGDMVVFDQNDDGTLYLRPAQGKSGGRSLAPFQVEATLFASPGELEFLVAGAYRAGHDSIEILSDVPLTLEAVEEVQAAARRLLGVSVVAHEPNRLVVQSFLDPSKYSLPQMIQRMRMILSALVEEAEGLVRREGPSRSKRAPALSEELGKVHALLVRQLQLASRDWSLAREIGSPDPRHLLSWRVVVQSLGESGRILVDLLPTLSRGRGTPNPARAEILQAYQAGLETVVDALVHPSLTRACAARDQVHTLQRKLESARPERSRRVSGRTPLSFNTALRQGAKNLEGLVEVAMDRAVTGDPRESRTPPGP